MLSGNTNRSVWRSAATLVSLFLPVLLCSFPYPVQAQSDHPLFGSITGLVLDPSGALVVGARVKYSTGDLARGDTSSAEALTGDNGEFLLTDIAPGPFELSISASGFAPKSVVGVLGLAQVFTVPEVILALASANTEVQVGLSRLEIAEEQIKDQEKQRLLSAIPNFYVTYAPNAVPLTSKQKFELAWKFAVDPWSFAVTGAVAGIQQASNDFSGYGQGTEGYAKRYGASYAGFVTGTFVGNAILPSLLKQDPRYFYKGTGSKRSRILYAISASVRCKGDNGRWQPNYSALLGGLAAGSIANLYYPAKDRNGAGLTFESLAIGTAGTAAANLLQEFFFRKLTPNHSKAQIKP